MKQLIKFDDNLRLVCHYIPNVRSVSCVVFVGTGSASETSKNNGLSHFLEHMIFKGTKDRSAFSIVEEIENIGGTINAFTSKQLTAYYTVCTDEHTEKAVEILSDIVINSQFSETEIEKEKEVILKELNMSDDDAQDLCIEMLLGSLFKKNSLGQTILGKKKNIEGMTRDMLLDYYNNKYTSGNTVIVMVGNIKIEDATKLAKTYFVNKFNKSNISVDKEKDVTPSFNYVKKFRAIEQANVAIGFKGYDFFNKDANALMLLNLILGNGMSSRLFQKIREELALAYSVYSYTSTYLNNGLLTIYMGTTPKYVEKGVRAIKEEIEIFKKQGITEKEFLRGREQVKSNFIIAQESTSAVMRNHGKYVLFTNAPFDIDSYVDQFNNYTIDDIHKTLEVFDFSNVNVSYVGKKHNVDLLGLLKD